MTAVERWAFILAVACYTPLQISPPVLAQAPDVGHEPAGRVRQLLSQTLPKLDGNNLRLQIVQVRYEPGESSQPHSHPCPVTGYVLEGAVRMQVQDRGADQPGPVRTYRAGESFYEAPNGHHLISANASENEPAVFLATFVCDHTTALTVVDHSATGTHP